MAMAFFGESKLFEDLGTIGIGFGRGQGVVQGRALLFHEVVVAIAGNVLTSWWHEASILHTDQLDIHHRGVEVTDGKEKLGPPCLSAFVVKICPQCQGLLAMLS